MAIEEQLAILRQGTKAWNRWRKKNRVRIDLRSANLQEIVLNEANLRGANLEGANLSEADLSEADLSQTNLRNANLEFARLVRANLSEADLWGANLTGMNGHKVDMQKAKLREANLAFAYLPDANLQKADLRGANLHGTDLTDVDFTEANLSGAILMRAQMIGAQLAETNLSYCRIFGISAWRLNLKGATQANLIITDDDESIITVDDLEVAQFIYLLIHNPKLRDIIDTIGKKAVLILGRFTDERKAVLEAIREELRRRDYIPILFDFEKPDSRDVTETVVTLAHMARFVIADLTDPRSLPHELMSFVEGLPSVAVQPLILSGQREYGMFEHFRRYPWVLPIHEYESQD